MFRIVYHPLVTRKDIPKLPHKWRDKIERAINKRLALKPELYGKPLRSSLRGFHKLRVGDYRIIFIIEKSIVKIMAIDHRSTVYSKISKRAFF
ncbi:MAG TPA: type II toxin-antitoxin system RelE/ParE family toxin [Candidatus Paceibacterota bacterium]